MPVLSCTVARSLHEMYPSSLEEMTFWGHKFPEKEIVKLTFGNFKCVVSDTTLICAIWFTKYAVMSLHYHVRMQFVSFSYCSPKTCKFSHVIMPSGYTPTLSQAFGVSSRFKQQLHCLWLQIACGVRIVIHGHRKGVNYHGLNYHSWGDFGLLQT